jgi:hypothetical protein
MQSRGSEGEVGDIRRARDMLRVAGGNNQSVALVVVE